MAISYFLKIGLNFIASNRMLFVNKSLLKTHNYNVLNKCYLIWSD